MSWFYGSQTTTTATTVSDDKVVNTLLNYALNNDESGFFSYVSRSKIDIKKPQFKDGYGQTPLHFATMYRNRQFVKRLLECGVNTDTNDMFRRTPLDIAIQQNDVEIVKLLNTNSMQDYNYLKSENMRLTEEVKDLDTNYKKVLDVNTLLSKQQTNIKFQLDDTKKSLKRTRSEYEDKNTSLTYYTGQYKRLKIENNKLKVDNKVLQDTVNNLRSSNRKK